MGSKAALVEQIKEIQKTNAGGKQAWWNHCDTNLGGVRDPNRHEEHVLSAFMRQYSSGALSRPAIAIPAGGKGCKGGWWAPPLAGPLVAGGAGGAGLAGLAGFIKEGQRRSQSWREAWQKYCAVYAEGYNDPARHKDEVLVGFLDFAGRLASGELDTQAEQQGVDLESKGLKRAAPASEWEPPAKRGGDAGTNGDEKGGLVQKVKDLQRSGPEAKQAWWTYCDESLGGVRDPSRHEASVLSGFLATFGAN